MNEMNEMNTTTVAAEQTTVTVAPAKYEGWTISGRIEAGVFVALPVLFGSTDPTRPLATVRVQGWEGGTVALDAADLIGSVRAEGNRQWRSILNGF